MIAFIQAIVPGGTEQLHQFLDVITPIAIAFYTIVMLVQQSERRKNQLDINKNINAVHERLAQDKAELVANQVAVKAELQKNHQGLNQNLAVHIAQDELMFKQILDKLSNVIDWYKQR